MKAETVLAGGETVLMNCKVYLTNAELNLTKVEVGLTKGKTGLTNASARLTEGEPVLRAAQMVLMKVKGLWTRTEKGLATEKWVWMMCEFDWSKLCGAWTPDNWVIRVEKLVTLYEETALSIRKNLLSRLNFRIEHDPKTIRRLPVGSRQHSARND
jgi:hypothetical protein